jgi:hypothetical protein
MPPDTLGTEYLPTPHYDDITFGPICSLLEKCSWRAESQANSSEVQSIPGQKITSETRQLAI